MKIPSASKWLLWPATLALSLYAIILVAASGDFGFDADDWWIFSWAYWFPYPDSVWAYAKELLRPLEGLYWLSMFELVAFNRFAFHIASLLLWIGSAVSMGACLHQAFPQDRQFVVTSVFLVFFLPMVSSLTFIIFTDNARLSILLFWISAYFFLIWANGNLGWRGLFLPILFYVLSFLTYENASLLIIGVPLLALPARSNRGTNPFEKVFLVKLASAIALALGISVVIRFTLLSGGAVAHRHIIPPLDLVVWYVALLPHYLVAPFLTMPDTVASIVGILVAVMFLLCLYASERSNLSEPAYSPQKSLILHSISYKFFLGFVLFVLGMLPYQMAGYGNSVPKISETAMAMYGLLPQGDTSWFNFNWASRIYSSASCGVAIVIAAATGAARSRSLRCISIALLTAIVGFMAAFHFGLCKDWQEAAEIRNELVRSLLRQVPAVRSHTNFIFLDLETYHKRAAVIRRWAGLRELIRMLYDDRTLGAWYLYPYAQVPPNKQFQRAIVLPGGFVSRGVTLDKPAPHDTLLVLKRDGKKLVLLEKITPGDGSVHTGISWRGATALRCNKSRIISSCGLFIRQKYHCQNKRWICSLVSTLKLRDSQ